MEEVNNTNSTSKEEEQKEIEESKSSEKSEKSKPSEEPEKTEQSKQSIKDDLLIPDIPPPKVAKKKKLSSPVLEAKIFSDLKFDQITHQLVIIECDRCGGPISVPVERNMILGSPEPVVEFVYIHGKPKHCLIAQLDRNFNERRRRTADLIDEDDFR